MTPVKVPPVVMAGTAFAVQQLLAGRRRTTPASRAVATGLALGSTALAVLAGRRFMSVQTTIDPMEVSKASTLVVDGPYRFTRNPMYTGLAGLLVAHACARRSSLALLPVLGYGIAISRLQIRREEATLFVLFGQEYARYRERVPRWFALRTLARRT